MQRLRQLSARNSTLEKRRRNGHIRQVRHKVSERFGQGLATLLRNRFRPQARQFENATVLLQHVPAPMFA
jgi:hypothetical protein